MVIIVRDTTVCTSVAYLLEAIGVAKTVRTTMAIKIDERNLIIRRVMTLKTMRTRSLQQTGG